MASSPGVDRAVLVFSYLGPFITFGWFMAASLYSILSLQNLDTIVRKKTRKLVYFFESVICGLFAAEAVSIVVQLFNEPGPLATTPNNIYALSQCLVFLTMTIILWGNSKHQWYPHYGAWIITLILDLLTSTGMRTPDKPVEWIQLSVRGARITMLCLVLVILTSMAKSDPPIDEEHTPLLKQNNLATTKVYNGTNPEENAQKDSDDAVDKNERELQEKYRKIEARLKSTGNWFTYIKEYSVFVPILWPSDAPKLKLNIIGVAICLLIERSLTFLKPISLGLVANYLAQGQAKEAFISLAIFGALRWLDSPGGLDGLRQYLWTPVENNANARLHTSAFDHLMSLSCDFHDNKQSGESHSAVSQAQSVTVLLQCVLFEILPNFLDLFVAGFYLYFLFDAYLVLIAVTTGVLYLALAMSYAGRQSELIRKRNASWRHKYQMMYDTLGSWRTVVYFNQLRYTSKMYHAAVSLASQRDLILDVFWIVKEARESILLNLANLSAFAYAGYAIIYGDKTVGSFIALQMYWISFTSQITYLPHLQRQFLGEFVNAEELLQILKMKPSVIDGPNELSLKDGLVEFQGVAFSYDNTKPIIHDLNFHVRPGQTIAFVGETGAGKSTLLKLLIRFYDVTAGSIKIDGQDIRDVTVESLRSHIGVVPQDPSMFNDTIMANVRYANLDATDEEVKEACKAAAIHDKILTFKDGYESKVGERGIKLSGGELQRVAIARAILKSPKIILLDEATSSVDTDTEFKIQEALSTLTSGRTTFVVAHRLSTIQNADRIVVVHDGTIVEQGTLKQLIKLKGRFHNLWSKQIIADKDAHVKLHSRSRSNSIAEGQLSSQSTRRNSGNTSEASNKDEGHGKDSSS